MSESLGPLERVDGRWASGDARRPDPRWYRTKDVLTLQSVMTQSVEDGEAHRLGDADWTARVVARSAAFDGRATTGADQG